jgi:ribonuclease P protein component
LTVPKALGKAVDRNRIKRRLREAVRSALPRLSAPVDVVLHPRRTVLDADFPSIRRDVDSIFRMVAARTAGAAAPGPQLTAPAKVPSGSEHRL